MSNAIPVSCASKINVSYSPYIDTVLQRTMMWLFFTIACLICSTEKCNASPEVFMDVVSPAFSLLFS